jgi:hypothetical protein
MKNSMQRIEVALGLPTMCALAADLRHEKPGFIEREAEAFNEQEHGARASARGSRRASSGRRQNHCGEPRTIFLDVATAGLHTVSFSMREDGFEFDKWAMTQDPAWQPPPSGKRWSGDFGRARLPCRQC